MMSALVMILSASGLHLIRAILVKSNRKPLSRGLAQLERELPLQMRQQARVRLGRLLVGERAVGRAVGHGKKHALLAGRYPRRVAIILANLERDEEWLAGFANARQDGGRGHGCVHEERDVARNRGETRERHELCGLQRGDPLEIQLQIKRACIDAELLTYVRMDFPGNPKVPDSCGRAWMEV